MHSAVEVEKSIRGSLVQVQLPLPSSSVRFVLACQDGDENVHLPCVLVKCLWKYLTHSFPPSDSSGLFAKVEDNPPRPGPAASCWLGSSGMEPALDEPGMQQ